MTYNLKHYNDVIMGATTFQITSLTIVYSSVHSGSDQRKHRSSASLAFVQGIDQWPVNSPHKWPATWKMFPFDDVIMKNYTSLPTYVQNIFVWQQSSLVKSSRQTSWQTHTHIHKHTLWNITSLSWMIISNKQNRIINEQNTTIQLNSIVLRKVLVDVIT